MDRLSSDSVIGTGLKAIGQLQELNLLEITSIGVGDDDLVHLTGLKKLRFLRVISPYVTEEGIAKLRLALPECQIAR